VAKRNSTDADLDDIIGAPSKIPKHTNATSKVKKRWDLFEI